MHPLSQGQGQGRAAIGSGTIPTGTLGPTAGISVSRVGEKDAPVGESKGGSDLSLPNPNPQSSAPDLADLEEEKKRVEQSIYNKLKGITHIYTSTITPICSYHFIIV